MSWQVYRKVRGYWLPIGKPTSRAYAEAAVERIKATMTEQQAREDHPHCVPTIIIP